MRNKVSEEYRELVHYTNAAGLSGIVTSGCLWATHASFLNDSEEIRHFFGHRLVDLVRSDVSAYLTELQSDPKAASKIDSEGGVDLISEKEAIRISSSLREYTLATNNTYIFSLCAPIDEQTRRSGLLSQWRGYGYDGGYAIVFDTQAMESLFEEEAPSYMYKHFQWGDVFYHGVTPDLQPSRQEIQEWEESLRRIVNSMLRDEQNLESDELYQVITSLSCLYKHWGFREEREVRIIAVAATHKELELANVKPPDIPEKPVKTYLRNGMPIPYIELFAKTKEGQVPHQLPIKEVIIGPHPDSGRRKTAVKQLMEANGYSVEVVCSEIPYIGR